MKIKKGILALSILLLLAVSPLVSAQIEAPPLGAPDLAEGSFGKFIYDVFAGFFNFIGAVIDTSVEEAFYTKVLFFILFVTMIYPVVNRIEAFKGNAAMSLIVTLIIAILGTRFLTDSVINLILVPYGVLAILATTMIPLMILFTFTTYFIPPQHELLKTVTWIIAAVSFFGLLIHRWDDVGSARAIYLLAGCFSLIAAVFQHKLKEMAEENKPYQRELERVQGRIAHVHHELARAEAEENAAEARILRREILALKTAAKGLKGELYGGWYTPILWLLVSGAVLFGAWVIWSVFQAEGISFSINEIIKIK